MASAGVTGGVRWSKVVPVVGQVWSVVARPVVVGLEAVFGVCACVVVDGLLAEPAGRVVLLAVLPECFGELFCLVGVPVGAHLVHHLLA